MANIKREEESIGLVAIPYTLNFACKVLCSDNPQQLIMREL